MPYLKEIREKKNEFTLQCQSLTVNFSLDEKSFYILLSVVLNISSSFLMETFPEIVEHEVMLYQFNLKD